MKYRYFRNNPRAYDKLSPRAEREKDSSPFFLSFSVQQFDKATSVSASKGIERDYWTVDWITGLLSRISFLPSFECKARRINFRVGRRFYSYEKLPEGGGKKRNRERGKAVVVRSFRGHEVTCALSSRPRASCRVFNAGYRRYVRIFCLLRFTSPFTSAPGSSWRTNVGRDKFIAEYCTRALCDTTVWKVARSPISIVFVFPPRFHPLTKTSCKEKEKR